VIHDGYTSTFVKKVDPSMGSAATASLTPRAPVADPGRVVRGRVVDSHGRPLRAAVIQPIGVSYESDKGPISAYGTIDGLEPVAVSNAEGAFELAYSRPAKGMLLRVEARGMAQRIVAAPTGAEGATITVGEGAVIRGRLVNAGKPVAGAEVGLIARERGGYGADLKVIGNPYAEIRIGTQEDGTFVISNVPAPVEWYVYGKMESIAALGASDPLECATLRDGEEVNAGDIQIHPGHRFRGTVTLGDGAAIADGMRVTIDSTRAWDSQTVVIGRDGRFEFIGLPTAKYEIFTSVRGYQLQEGRRVLETTVDRDIDSFAITLDRAARR
jgi:hypothetical protein